MKDNNGLLIASLVAIVAIVGLVILFQGGASGALDICGEGMQYVLVQDGRGQTGKVCVPQYPVAQLDDFGHAAGDAGKPSDATNEAYRSFVNWCTTFPDVCCQAYPNKCSMFLGG